jgi:hypothetical protein
MNGLDALIKRHMVAKLLFKKKQTKQGPTICHLKETHFNLNNRDRLKVMRWKNIFHGNDNQKRAR